ncbi:MAG: M3 family oligoendopeptidase [Lachnospiraceae bacterium]|jgi:M3 family oligoendopeptidase|nr:M3 family oligoendopeptidase [Lachnospiraceae bacterium]
MKLSEMPYERLDQDWMERTFASLIERQKQAADGAGQFAVHQEYYRLMNHIQTCKVLARFRYDMDTSDAFYADEVEFYDKVGPVVQSLDKKYQEVLLASPYRPYMEGKIGQVAFRNMELAFRSMDEKLIPLCQEENALAAKYVKVIASAEIPFEGEVYNISQMGKFLKNQDRAVRRQAWKALSGYFMGVTGEIDGIFDSMVKNRTKQAQEMGYQEYTALGYCRMNRNSYGQQEVERFRSQVKKYLVPLATEIYESRRKRLGIEKLSYIDDDMFFPDGNPAPQGTPEEILAQGQQMYRELSPETAEFFDFMMEHELMDVLGRKSKKQGGYMDYMPEFKAPLIFANFNGTSGDVDVITHECGHAFQGYLMRNEEIREYLDITMETAEIHSMAMEYFTEKWMEGFFGSRAADYCRMHLEDSICFVPYGCMVDEFQHIIYAHPELSPEGRKDVWKKLEKEYRPHLDFEGDPFFGNGGRWQMQLHIFEVPFYYIDYCLSTICALQYKVKMDEDFQGAWDSYLRLCRLSAKEFYVPMLEKAGLESPFEDGCIQGIVRHFEKRLF